jgi:site-specific DNA-methyltransferase (adenine-specific)
MTKPIFDSDRTIIYCGDSRFVLKSLPDNSAHSIVTDPPGGASVLGLDFDDPETYGYELSGRLKTRGQFVSLMEEVFSECYRILVPGGWGVVWTFPRTAHWTVWALEDVGFEIRDEIQHVYSSAMPRSQNVEKATDGAVKGRGTGLKPCHEGWVLIRKPLIEPTVGAQVLATDTGAIRIDDCRVPHANPEDFAQHKKSVDQVRARGGKRSGSWKNSSDLSGANEVTELGRWPGNLVLTHDSACVVSVRGSSCTDTCPVGQLGESSKYFKTFLNVPKPSASEKNARLEDLLYSCAVCDRMDIEPFCDHEVTTTRLVNDHPTTKPILLVRYLLRMVTPPGGVVMDPFLGSGTTAVAADLEGCRILGVEKELKWALLCKARARRACMEAYELGRLYQNP